MTRGLRQCKAYHGQVENLRCQRLLPEEVKCSQHLAYCDDDGVTYRWDDSVAVYPAVDGDFRANDPTMGAEVVRGKLADAGIGVANPDRVRATDPPVGNGSARLDQVGGEHYRKFKIQPWDVIDEYDLSFYAGNALKYLLRAGHKGSRLEDLKKCRHYLDKLIEREEGQDE